MVGWYQTSIRTIAWNRIFRLPPVGAVWARLLKFSNQLTAYSSYPNELKRGRMILDINLHNCYERDFQVLGSVFLNILRRHLYMSSCLAFEESETRVIPILFIKLNSYLFHQRDDLSVRSALLLNLWILNFIDRYWTDVARLLNISSKLFPIVWSRNDVKGEKCTSYNLIDVPESNRIGPEAHLVMADRAVSRLGFNQ